MKDRAALVRAIRLVNESLESHLDYSVKCEQLCESCGDRAFHAKCVREYVYVLKVLSDFL